MVKLFNIIFDRFYKYYGEDTGLVYSTILLSSIVCLIGGGIYIIVFKAINQTGEPLFFLENSKSTLKFRLIWGPAVVLVIQQIFYRIYINNGYYKKIVEYYKINEPSNFFSKNAHYVSFIFSMLFFVASFIIGDYVNELIYK